MRYKVIAKKHKVFGKSFGEFFDRNLPDAQERTLIGGGFIVRAPQNKRPTPAIVQVVDTPVVELPVEQPPLHVQEINDASEDGADTEPSEGMNTHVQEADSA
jgi:hypothetical protein